MQNSITYHVSNPRLVPTTGKVKEKNPDRIATLHGEFRNVDAKGKPTGDPLTFGSKEITVDIARNPITVIDLENGVLTLPAGERGRKALSGIDQDAVNAMLAAVREDATAEGDAEGDAEGEAEANSDAEADAEAPSASE